MRDHEKIEELLTLEALGAFDGPDADELATLLAEHGPDCGECARLRADLAETAGLLPFSLDPVPAPAGLDALPAPSVAAPTVAPPPRKRSRSVAVLVAAALVGALIGVAIGVNVRQGGGTADTSPTLAALLAQPGTTVVPFEGDTGNVVAAVAADGSRAYVVGSGLAPLPEGKVFELWSITGKTPTSIGCAGAANGSISQPVAADLAGADVLAVTVEDASCPAAPTTTPILTASLS